MNQPNNSSFGSISPQQANTLLGMAGKQLGQNPAALRAQLQNGQLGSVLSSLDPQKAAQVQSLINDPQKLEGFLNSPQVKALLGGLMNQNGKK